MQKLTSLVAAVISGLTVTSTVFTVPHLTRLTGSDLSRMRGDTEKVGNTMRSVMKREHDRQKAAS